MAIRQSFYGSAACCTTTRLRGVVILAEHIVRALAAKQRAQRRAELPHRLLAGAAFRRSNGKKGREAMKNLL